MRIAPWNGEPGHVCLPLAKNVPARADWVLTTCPKCGEECWEQPGLKELVATGKVEAVCTMCALKGV